MSVSLKRSQPDPAPVDDSDETASEAGSEAVEAKRAKMEFEGRIDRSRLAHVNLAYSIGKLFNVALDAVHKHEREHHSVVLEKSGEDGDLVKVKDEILKLIHLAHEMGQLDADEYEDVFVNGEEEWNQGDDGMGRCGICHTSLPDGSQCMCSC